MPFLTGKAANGLLCTAPRLTAHTQTPRAHRRPCGRSGRPPLGACQLSPILAPTAPSYRIKGADDGLAFQILRGVIQVSGEGAGSVPNGDLLHAVHAENGRFCGSRGALGGQRWIKWS